MNYDWQKKGKAGNSRLCGLSQQAAIFLGLFAPFTSASFDLFCLPRCSTLAGVVSASRVAAVSSNGRVRSARLNSESMCAET